MEEHGPMRHVGRDLPLAQREVCRGQACAVG